MERTGYNFGVSMLLAGGHEFLGFLTASVTISKIPRKAGLIFFNLLSALAGIGFSMPFIDHSPVVQSLIISLTRITCVFSYSLFSLLQTETFNPFVKSTAIGITVGLSQTGRIAVPYIINAMN